MCFSAEAARATQKDRDVAARLERFLPGVDRAALFRELQHAKADVSGQSRCSVEVQRQSTRSDISTSFNKSRTECFKVIAVMRYPVTRSLTLVSHLVKTACVSRALELRVAAEGPQVRARRRNCCCHEFASCELACECNKQLSFWTTGSYTYDTMLRFCALDFNTLTHSLTDSLTHSLTHSLTLSVCLSVCLSVSLSLSLSLSHTQNFSNNPVRPGTGQQWRTKNITHLISTIKSVMGCSHELKTLQKERKVEHI